MSSPITNENNQQLKETSACFTTSVRSVHFPQNSNDLSRVVCFVPSRCDLTTRDRQILWFQQAEFTVIKRTARVIASDSSSYGLGAILDDCYGEMTEERQANINQWCMHGHSRRGLERWSSRIQGNRRVQDNQRTVEETLSIQAVMKLTGGVNEEVLGQQYSQMCYIAKGFALMMGRADCNACINNGSNIITWQQHFLRSQRSMQNQPSGIGYNLLSPNTGPTSNSAMTPQKRLDWGIGPKQQAIREGPNKTSEVCLNSTAACQGSFSSHRWSDMQSSP